MPMCKEVSGTPISLGAQNVYHEASGAFTGEIAPAMLVDAGCSFTLVGHSERRQLFAESGETLSRKVQAALGADLDVIYCVGETLAERQADQTTEVLKRQLNEAVAPDLQHQRLTIAYEPVWAIGTGLTATAEQAQDAHRFIRNWLAERLGGDASETIRIQYGGSVKPSNAGELLAMPDVDGALVGGASLKADDFAGILEAAA
jgi:triosephosphate isomerase